MAERAAAHAGHDLDVLAALVDDPANATDATDATDAACAQVAECPECAALVADLRLLAGATATLAVPSRPRDLRLSPEDLVRLTATSREPVAVSGRLGFDMTTPALDHATHDPLLIAAHLDSTLDARDSGRVDDWLARCSSCVTLRSDFEALAVATRMLPTPPRPRDFRLTASDADRLRGWGWRSALAVFASQRASFTRPLAMGLTTMGLVGLLIANIPSVALFGAAGAAPAPSQAEMSTDVAAPAALAPAAGPAGALASPAAIRDAAASAAASAEADITGEYAPEGGSGDRNAVSSGSASTGSDSAKGSAVYESLGGEPGGGPSVLVLASATLLLTGLALAFLRWWARRLSAG